MLRYVYGDDLGQYPTLQDTMHRDRATQFRDRLKWDVTVDDRGWEQDEYDSLNPLYVIWEEPGGIHGGSMRFLPTSGRTMVNDHFGHLSDVHIESPLIWECTRFCLAPKASPKVAGALMLAGGELMRAFALTHLLGVFDARMVRIGRRIGWEPTVLGTSDAGKDSISVGLWEVSEEARNRICARSGFSVDTPSEWFAASFTPNRELEAA